MRGRTGHDLLLCIIMVMECEWGIETVINLSKLIDYGAVPANPYYYISIKLEVSMAFLF